MLFIYSLVIVCFCCSCLVACCLMLVTQHSLFEAYDALRIVRRVLVVGCWLVRVVCCLLCVVCCVLFAVRC